jgi:hypothetical protein
MEHFVFYRRRSMVIKLSSDSCTLSFERDISTKMRYDQIIKHLKVYGRKELYMPDILHNL